MYAPNSHQKTEWISHRGLCLNHDENTHGAFEAAVNSGFTILETDLRLTKDKHVVLLHDESLHRVSRGEVSGKVSAYTKQELDSISLAKGGRLYYLSQFIKDFESQSWVFDVKPEAAFELIVQLDELLKINPSLLKTIFFLFWKSEHQKAFQNLQPEAICFSREFECIKSNLAFLLNLDFLSGVEKGNIYSIPPSFKGMKVLSKAQVEKFQARGARVIAYLPSNLRAQQLAVDSGCDYIISDIPPLLGSTKN